MNDVMNQATGNIESPSKRFVRPSATGVHRSDHCGIRGLQLRRSDLLAANDLLGLCFGVVIHSTRNQVSMLMAPILVAAHRAPLLHHIFGIVFVRSSEEMAWIDAQSNVAFMAHKEPERDWPNIHRKRNTMSGRRVANGCLSISRPLDSWTNPQPARSKVRSGNRSVAIDLFPKVSFLPFRKVDGKWNSCDGNASQIRIHSASLVSKAARSNGRLLRARSVTYTPKHFNT